MVSPAAPLTLVTADQLLPTLEQVLRLCSARQVQVSADSTPLVSALLNDPRPAHDLTTGETLLNLNEPNIWQASILPVGTLEGQLVHAVASRPFEHFRTRQFDGDLAHWIARDFWTAWDFVYRLTSAYALKLTTVDSAEVSSPQSIRHLMTVCRARHPEFTPERLRGLRVTDGQRFFLQPFFAGLEELGLLEE